MLSCSSFKQGFGLDNLSQDSFWQSDGPLPHSLIYSFPKRTWINTLSLLVDFKQDESYTPQQMTVLVDGLEFTRYSCVEPCGWIHIPIGHHCWSLVVQITLNHQNGKDSHVRRIKFS